MRRSRGIWSTVAALMALALICGCSSDDSGSPGSAYVLGELHGEMADEVVDLLRPRPWSGQSDLPLVLQASTVQTLTDEQTADLHDLWVKGGAVVVLEARNDDLARLHAILGTRVPVTVPADPPYDHFAVYVAGQTATGYRTGSVFPFPHPTAAEDPESSRRRVDAMLAWAFDVETGETVAAQDAGVLQLPTSNLPNQFSWSYSIPADWYTCGSETHTCSDNVQQFVSAYSIYSSSAPEGQPSDFFVMTSNATVSTAGCTDFYGNRSHSTRISAYWLRQFNTETVVQGNFPFSELTINSGPPSEGGYAPQQADPNVQHTTGTNWSLGGSGTVGTKAAGSSIGFNAGVSFVNQNSVSYQALTTDVNIGETANNASWTYDSWNYVHTSIEPSDRACGGGGLNPLPGIIYGNTFNPVQTWVWQAMPSVRSSLGGDALPVQVNNSALLGWTYYVAGEYCAPASDVCQVQQYYLDGDSTTNVASNPCYVDNYAPVFDVGCNVTTHYGTIPLGPFDKDGQDNSIGNPGTPMPGPQMICNIPFAPTTVPTPAISTLAPDSGPAGTTVTITGTGLSTATQINFGGMVITTFVTVSDTELQVAAPAGLSGAVPVTVQSASGISNSLTYTYE